MSSNTTTWPDGTPRSQGNAFDWRRWDLDEETRKARTKTQQLLDAIDQLGRGTTMRLCLETDLDSRAVWGLLKLHRKSGRVQFNYGEWSPGVSAQTIKAQQATQLLRSLGWTVTEPRSEAP